MIAIFTALADANVRYLVVGGVAVNAHGYERHTKDLDLVIQLEDKNLSAALEVLQSLGFRPKVPVPIEAFADSALRQSWTEEKGMIVFQLWSDDHPSAPIDIFISEPFDFEIEEKSALIVELPGSITVPVLAIPSLISLKTDAGRPQDIIDIEKLKIIEELANEPDS